MYIIPIPRSYLEPDKSIKMSEIAGHMRVHLQYSTSDVFISTLEHSLTVQRSSLPCYSVFHRIMLNP